MVLLRYLYLVLYFTHSYVKFPPKIGGHMGGQRPLKEDIFPPKRQTLPAPLGSERAERCRNARNNWHTFGLPIKGAALCSRDFFSLFFWTNRYVGPCAGWSWPSPLAARRRSPIGADRTATRDAHRRRKSTLSENIPSLDQDPIKLLVYVCKYSLTSPILPKHRHLISLETFVWY